MKKRMSLSAMLMIISLLMAVILSFSASAKTGGRLTLVYDHPGAVFSVYQVSDEQKNLTESFAGYGISLDCTTNEEWMELAVKLAGYADRDHVNVTAAGAVEHGAMEFSGLPEGWYLVVGADTKEGTITYKPVPVLVEVVQRIPVKANIKADQIPDGEEPTNPAGPSDPTNPSDPTGPSDPTDPSDPSGSEDPSQPSRPSGGGSSGGGSSGSSVSSTVGASPSAAETIMPFSEETGAAERQNGPGGLPKTGDRSLTVVWVILLVASAIGILVLLIGKKREHEPGEKTGRR